MSLIRHSPYKSTSSENVGPTVLTQLPDNHNKEIGKNSINFNSLFSINPYSPGVPFGLLESA